MKIWTIILLLLAALLFQPTRADAASRTGQLPATTAAAAGPNSTNLRTLKKQQRWNKRLARWQKKFEKRQARQTRRGHQTGARLGLGIIGLIVLLLGGMLIVLGLVIPVVGLIFIISGIIVAFAGLVLLLLLGSVSVDVS